jgi:hypothetical protein
MPDDRNILQSEISSDQPKVLIVAFSMTHFVDSLAAWLKSQQLSVLLLTDTEKETGSDVLKQEFYKIIFCRGFGPDSWQEDLFLKEVFTKFSSLSEKTSAHQCVFIGNYFSPISRVDSPNPLLDDLSNREIQFFEQALQQYPEAIFLFARDLLIEEQFPGIPLALFFEQLPHQQILNFPQTFYWFSQKTFLEEIKKLLLKPGQPQKIIFRGSAWRNGKTAKECQRLFEQYFQRKLQLVEPVITEYKVPFLKLFTQVSVSENASMNIDRFIRLFPVYEKKYFQHLTQQNQLVLHSANLSIEGLQPTRTSKTVPVLRTKNDSFSAIPAKISPKDFLPSQQTIQQTKNVWKKQDEQSKQMNQDEAQTAVHLRPIRTSPPIKEKINSNNIDESIKIENKIEEIFSKNQDGEEQDRLTTTAKSGKKIVRKRKKRKALLGVGVFLLVLSGGVLSLYGFFQLNKHLLQVSTLGRLENAITADKNSLTFEVARPSWSQRTESFLFSQQLTLYEKLFSESQLQDSREIAQLTTSLDQLQKLKEESSASKFSLYQSMLTGEGDLSAQYDELLTQTGNEEQNLGAVLELLNNFSVAESQKEKLANIEKTLESKQKLIQQENRFLTAFKEVLLSRGRTEILLAIQDESELRSSGGFLDGALLLSFNNGYFVDKQLLSNQDIMAGNFGQRQADPKLQNYLGEENLEFRDSNWAANFSQAAQDMSWFVDQATGGKIDAVVTLNYQTLLQLIDQLDGVEVDGESIKSQNFFASKEKLANQDYQKNFQESFSGKVVAAYLEKLLHLESPEQLDKENQVVLKALASKESLAYSSDETLSAAFKANVWTGELLDSICPNNFVQDNCFLDSFYQVENNVGINKVNSYMSETISHSLGISKEFIRHKHQVVFKNESKTTAWPLGSYKLYLQFFIPQQAEIEKVQLDDETVDPNSITQEIVDNKKQVSLYLEIPAKSQKSLVFTYLIKNEMKTPFSYVFLDQKQPGFLQKTTAYNIVFDENFKPQLIAPQAEYKNQVIHFQNDNQDNFIFAVSFQ